MSLSILRSTVAAAGLWAGALAVQAEQLPYTRARLDTALAQGKPVIVDLRADWCPTCKEQKPIVDALLKEDKRKGITLLLADFDNEDALKDRLHVTQQSTFVVFKAGKEVGRSTGQTDKAQIAALFDKAL
ncbi:MAG: thioredoxin family protein [Proteobacteria bacterium]|nr:thioredoxin family protein [Pseudomonadota bacterium]